MENWTLIEYFYHWEKEKPNEVYLRQPFGKVWKEYTWKEVGDNARRIAAALQDMQLPMGSHIGILSKNCVHWVMADLAIMMAGYVSVPFYPNMTAEQLKLVLDKSDCAALFVGKLEEWEQQKEGVDQNLPIIRFPHYENNSLINEGKNWDDLLQQFDPLPKGHIPQLDDLWTILYTSGTTGTPKGVMLPFGSATKLLQNEREHNNLTIFQQGDQRFFSYLPLNHIAERIIVESASLFTGGTVSFAESIDTFAQNLEAVQPTLFMGVPRIYTKFQMAILEKIPVLNMLLSTPIISVLLKKVLRKKLGLSQAKILLTGAAPTPESLHKWYRKLGLPLQEVYGMTENCAGCTLMPKVQYKQGTVGQLLPNVELRIDQETQEVIMRVPWQMVGYYNEPEMTAKVIQEGWIHTADQGSLDHEGFLSITGRVNDNFKTSKGKYVVPNPIEMQFAHNYLVEQICIVGIGIPQPIALVVLSETGKKLERNDVFKQLTPTLDKINQTLSRFEKVKAIVILNEEWSVSNNLLTPTLKVKRQAIHERYHQHYQQWYDQQHAVIWAENQTTEKMIKA
ncbi:AMP-binding protein [Limibacter armeniacum]|uniref:AMP-binding protein n=1 Tax=Limibacter armeniacum TaxID=466084 RepID=UPI002FE5873C